MRIRFPLSMSSFLLILFFISCSRETEEIPEEMRFPETYWLPMPPHNGTLKDSLRIAWNMPLIFLKPIFLTSLTIRLGFITSMTTIKMPS